MRSLEKAKAWLTLQPRNSRLARAIVEAVSPDNATAPKDLKVETWFKDGKVYCRIICLRGAETFLATLDDLLSSIGLAERTLKEAEK